ncbi:UNVERIFIED_CONTAM: hypothetical protein Sradi_7008100 [Sesamum radiatum]|uniref:Uncharacterized protein n=1 Tax=Sesamum radiatum TaxID=300843 RepID=A0AAW2JBJ5_SESRA
MPRAGSAPHGGSLARGRMLVEAVPRAGSTAPREPPRGHRTPAQGSGSAPRSGSPARGRMLVEAVPRAGRPRPSPAPAPAARGRGTT